MDYRDWGLKPMPEPPPPWALYWIGVAHSLSRELAIGGFGGAVHGPIAEAEVVAVLSSFPAHQHAIIRYLIGEVEAGEAMARRDLEIREAARKAAEG